MGRRKPLDAGAASPIPMEAGRRPLPPKELQQAWFATLRREWSSLVVVPADPRGSARAVASSLAEVAELHRGRGVKLIHAEGLDIATSSQLIIGLSTHVAAGGQVIVSIDSVLENQAGIPVALAADAALLCVALGRADLRSARKTLELIGEEKFLGAIALHKRRRRG